jgi:hypothetical protein
MQDSTEKYLVRIKPYTNKPAPVKSWTHRGFRYVLGAGWYAVPKPVADELSAARVFSEDPNSPAVFDIRTQQEALQDEENERLKALVSKPAIAPIEVPSSKAMGYVDAPSDEVKSRKKAKTQPKVVI